TFAEVESQNHVYSSLERQNLCTSPRSSGLPIAVKGYSMRGHQASHTALITPLLLLLVAVVSVDAQSRKSGRQEQWGVTVVPAAPAPHTAERRAALVIGNSAYAEGPLANPVNDATDMASALQQMGFAGTLLRDAELRRMRDAIETFRKELRPGVLGLFYF